MTEEKLKEAVEQIFTGKGNEPPVFFCGKPFLLHIYPQDQYEWKEYVDRGVPMIDIMKDGKLLRRVTIINDNNMFKIK